MWDTRKIYTVSSTKKHIDQMPLYIFDNHINPHYQISKPINACSKNSKGYSNLVMNSSGTRLYANCLNSQIYEFNYSSYNQNHTRIINSTNNLARFADKPSIKYHQNQSNYIKSSLSKCDSFILTGSSDHNAYIYSTNMNSSCDKFRKSMPVIVLKGKSHLN